MPPESDITALAEKMVSFAERTRVAEAMAEADDTMNAVHALATEAADIERDYAVLTTQEQADLKEQTRDTIAALERYIENMKRALEDTSRALEKLNNAGDAAGAYSSAQDAS